jgi:uncharacterized protein YdhG (YjbR/CyaY superfamily)
VAIEKEGDFVKNNAVAFRTIDEYIVTFPPEIQTILQTLRATIQAVAPDAEEKISYQIPTFALKGNLVHFAAYKAHIGFYPGPSGIKTFASELAKYETAKGSIRFPIQESLPLALIGNIVKFRVVENLKKAEMKGAKKARR